jgi:eukaryotic-like serine/threonine-protein kinase
MENQPRPPIPVPEKAGMASAPDGGEAAGSLRSTHVIVGTSSADTDNAGPPSAPPAPSAAPVQRTISQLGHYVLLKKLGSGAMGVVYKARDLTTGKSVALKVLFKHVADNLKLVERFHREARVSGELEHPNIVRGFEAGEDHGWHYFAMEYCPGDSLQKWLAKLGKVSLGDALNLVLRCAHGLQHAHAREMVHRDIKPDNILITRKGEVKVADLGMVKQLDEDMSLTQTGHAVGTPWYMPLEQAKNAKDTDGRCDIYALGCVFYACLTGHPPFSGKTLVDVIYAKEVGTFPPARQFNNEVPERVDLILLKMTAKQPKYRYQSCAELINDLEGLGLANASLSFLATVQPQNHGAAPSPDGNATPAPSKLTQVEPAKVPVHDLWYVRYKRPNGQPVVQKLTTAQVFKLLERSTFDTGAKASRHPAEGFRALATIKEFEKVALGRSARMGADKQTFRSRKLYEQIVEEHTLREKPPAPPVTTLRYWSGILARVLAVVLILAALYFGAVLVVYSFKTLFG